MTKTKRTSKNQQARELAMQARAEELDRQNKIMDATKEGFLALGELGPIVARFDAAVSALRALGEAKRDVARIFGLSVSVLTMLEQFLPAAAGAEGVEDDVHGKSVPAPETNSQHGGIEPSEVPFGDRPSP